jgi:M6 family metalloprotease-like protein
MPLLIPYHTMSCLRLMPLALLLLAGCGGGGGDTSPGTSPPIEVPVATISVSPATVQLSPAGTTTLTAVVRDAASGQLPGRPVMWTSSAPSVATVDASGTVTAVAVGTASITASIAGIAGRAEVTVIPVPVATVDVSPLTTTAIVGTTRPLTATARDLAGTLLLGRTVTWASANTTVATVNAEGLVTAVGVGSTSITARVDGVTGAATIAVTPVPVATVGVSPPTASLQAGTATTLAATARDAAGNALTDRLVRWASTSTEVATVSASGLVTAIGVGTASITATVDGVVGAATITVTAAPATIIQAVAGGNQQGLNDRPLADSLVVRLRTAAGEPAPGVPVNWVVTGGVVSANSTLTDASGFARVQWTPAIGNQTATATTPGLAPVQFTATTRTGGRCTLAPSAATRRFSIGPTDYTLSLRATAPLRIAVVYVDYPDAAASENAAQLMRTIVEPGLALMRELSHNRLTISAVSFPIWYRMPRPIASYNWSTYDGHRQHLLDVLAVTDAAIDYSSFDALFVFSPPAPSKPVSPTFNGGITANVVADGRNFGNAVTFGNDSRSYPASIVAHETGHMLGLVDLYAFTPAGGPFFPGNPFKFIGAWSLMSNVFTPAHYLMWEKRKLGWVDDAQVDCLEQAGGVEAVLAPNSASAGRKMVVVPIDSSSALVVEARDFQGLDANLCANGVLLYQVDARIPTGTGAVQVLGSRTSTAGTAFNRCGPWGDGTFGFGAPPINRYVHPPTGATVTVLRAETNGAYRIRVTR